MEYKEMNLHQHCLHRPDTYIGNCKIENNDEFILFENLADSITNHLDFMTLEAFEKALLEFEGAIVAVSHDATFIEKMATQEWRLGTG